MGKRDRRVDAYVAKSSEFARPILERIRDVVHATCPEAEETIKWSFPHFVYGDGTLCSMAAFKQHCAFGFWKATLIDGLEASDEAMGQLGRIRKLSDLPTKKTLQGWIRQAMALNETGIKVRRKPTSAKKPGAVPKDLAAALAKSARARKTFAALAPSHRREYVEWIEEAKRETTRAKRIATAIEWLAEGKRRNWKYEKG